MLVELKVLNPVNVEEILIFEYADAPEDVQTQEDVRSAIADVVKRVEAGERDIVCDYLNLRLVIG